VSAASASFRDGKLRLENLQCEMTSQVALTYTASLIVGLAAQQAGRPDLIRSPKRVLAHLWERDSEL
jgi:hypothetical protein